MHKDTLCILLLALSATHVQQAMGARQLMTDVLRLTNQSIETIFATAAFDFTKTQYAISHTFDTMLTSEMNQTTTDIQDPKLKSALEGLQSRFVALCLEVQQPIEEAVARIGSMQTTAVSCEASLKKMVETLMGKIGQCSTRRINLGITQINNCINDGVDHISGELIAIKRFLNDISTEFRNTLIKERRACLLKVEAAHCLNELMRNNLNVFFVNVEKLIQGIIKVRPTMEPLRLCTQEISAEIPRIC